MATTSEYNHVQTSASASWAVNHALASDSVAVDVMIDNGGNLEKILPADIRIDDANNITITFSSAQTGKARIVGEF